MKRKCYIAGPMQGYEEFNFPKFYSIERKLRMRGWSTFNPARKDEEKFGKGVFKNNTTGSVEEAENATGFSLRDALKMDLGWICDEATDIYMIKGWEHSKGAKTEHALAVALGLDIHYE